METITELQVIGVRYRGSTPAEGDERSLDAFADSGVYGVMDVPFVVYEPAFPEDQRAAEPTDNLGLMAGEIADAVAEARQAGRAVLITGGDCTHCTGVLGGLQDVYGPTA